jgi:hypothetical protein
MTPRFPRHRLSICRVNCATPCQRFIDGKINHADPAEACERGVWTIWTGPGGVAPPTDSAASVFVAITWHDLYALALRDALTSEIIERTTLGVKPCGISYWLRDIELHPLPAAGQFAWLNDRHNTVSKRIGKPILNLTEAKEIYDPR